MRGIFIGRRCVGLAAGLFWLMTAVAASAQSPSAKLEELVKKSGYTATKVNDNLWTIDFTGKQLPRFKVILSAGNKEQDGILVIFSTPVEKSRLPATPNFFSLLLKANHDFDYVKIGIDGEGDVFVRADIPDAADGGYFKNIVEQVAAASDQLYGRIKPMLRN